MMNKQLNTALQWAISNDKGLKSMGVGIDNLTAIYPYQQDGKEVFVKVRFDKDGKKWIKPFYHNGEQYRLGEPKLPKKPLYLPKPPDDTVYLVEGEKCVNALLDLGISATTTGGATSVDKCDLAPLQGRKCVIWRDNDNSGISWQNDLITALESLTIAHEVINVAGVTMPAGKPLADKADCYDFIQAHYADGNDDKGIRALIEHLPRLDPATLNSNANDDAGGAGADLLADLDKQVLELQEVIKELAELDEMRLHILIPKITKRYSISKDKLLNWVYEHKQGDFISEPAPYHESVSHDEIYTALYELVDNHIVIDEPLKVAFVLWVLFTYLTDIAEIAPIAWITAPERACGKTTLLALFERVVYRPYTMTDPTQAVLYRIMERYKPCLLIDEIDTGLKDKSAILGILNAGYSRHASKIGRVNNDKGGTVENFNAFGAKVLCGIGGLKSTTASRAIRFEMRRKGKDDKVKRLNKKTLPYSQTEIIRQKCKRWSDDNRQAVQMVDITPLNIDDRAVDSWDILLQIASVLGVYDKAVNACLAICQTKDEPSQNEQFLADIREVWHGEQMSSTLLRERLTADDEKAWATFNNGQSMNAHQFAKKLKQFGIKSKNLRQGGAIIKGFDKADFITVWDRYLPAPAEQENPFLLPSIDEE